MIRLIGTSHISPRSIETIRREINEDNPDCVAVELDRVRYNSLKYGGKKRSLSLTFRLISWLQRKLSERTGVFPGEEMMTAVEEAQKNYIDCYFIDQPIEATIKDFERITFFDKLKLILSSLAIKKPFSFDIKDVPSYELVNETVEHLKSKSPKVYNILVEKRDRVMSYNVMQLLQEYDDILVVVGIGHVPGMKRIFDDKDIRYEDKTF